MCVTCFIRPWTQPWCLPVMDEDTEVHKNKCNEDKPRNNNLNFNCRWYTRFLTLFPTPRIPPPPVSRGNNAAKLKGTSACIGGWWLHWYPPGRCGFMSFTFDADKRRKGGFQEKQELRLKGKWCPYQQRESEEDVLIKAQTIDKFCIKPNT